MESSGTLARLARGLSERRLVRVVYFVSAAVVLAVAVLLALPPALAVEGLDVSVLPAFHAGLNATATLLLVAGWVQIRSGRRAGHQALMSGAFALSCVFLVSYLVYHAQAEPTSFGGEGWIRPLYYTILITHIVLAPVVLPMALFTLLRALRGEFPRHRGIARWTLPLWLYVTTSGVLVYALMAPYY